MNIDYDNIDETDIDSILAEIDETDIDEIEKKESVLESSISNTCTNDSAAMEEKRRKVLTRKRQQSNVERQKFVESKLFSDLKASLSVSACTIIIFGASGHLAKTKTYPALYDLFCENVLPNNVNIVGYARSQLSKKEFHDKISIKLQGSLVETFLAKCSYFSGQGYDDNDSFKLFSEYIHKLEDIKYNGSSNRICYLATPPSVFIHICERIHKYLRNNNDLNINFMRVIIEKPFGKDLDSNNKLDYKIKQFLTENEIYRIDHYLAKEMVQNIIVFRFANVLWNSIWNRMHIKCIKISMKETTGLAGRGGYYDEYGVIRDVFQNHLLQILTLITMEQPCSLNANDIRDEKVKILKCIQPIQPQYTIVGQCDSYRKDQSIKNNQSNQITFIQTILYINNHRWNKVPFICKCGKGLDSKNCEIRIQFKNDELTLFPNANINEIVMRLQPNEAIWCKINTKTPGFARFDNAQMFELDITYKNRFGRFGPLKLPNAYTRLILDTLKGDQSLFVRSDELKESWRIVTPFLHKLENENKEPIKYEKGSRGPIQADQMAIQFGFSRTKEYNWQD